jgi:hypothetical protein
MHAAAQTAGAPYYAEFDRNGNFVSLSLPPDYDISDLRINRALIAALVALKVNEGGQL